VRPENSRMPNWGIVSDASSAWMPARVQCDVGGRIHRPANFALYPRLGRPDVTMYFRGGQIPHGF